MRSLPATSSDDPSASCVSLITVTTTECCPLGSQNKTPENVRAWITSPARFSVVAVEGSTVCGFGMLQRDGEIQLCYLVPEVQYQGAGKLMLRALEEQAAGWGLKDLFLMSTVTAKRFYERNGYVQTGEPKAVYGLERAYPMSKGIALTPR
jgi:GNAT superfamily N-acetyltransferase